jgi:hypothetical protein
MQSSDQEFVVWVSFVQLLQKPIAQHGPVCHVNIRKSNHALSFQ